MVIASPQITLEEFLQLPETKPAREYINGEIIQKPMPKLGEKRYKLYTGLIIVN